MKRKRGGGGTPSSGGGKTGGNGRKEYVPKTRTGAYAVLLTLAKEETDDGWRGYSLKAELQKKAQPLCDESLTHTSVHREYYSAWRYIPSEKIGQNFQPSESCFFVIDYRRWT